MLQQQGKIFGKKVILIFFHYKPKIGAFLLPPRGYEKQRFVRKPRNAIQRNFNPTWIYGFGVEGCNLQTGKLM